LKTQTPTAAFTLFCIPTGRYTTLVKLQMKEEVVKGGVAAAAAGAKGGAGAGAGGGGGWADVEGLDPDAAPMSDPDMPLSLPDAHHAAEGGGSNKLATFFRPSAEKGVKGWVRS
jgi:hypothetical protein